MKTIILKDIIDSVADGTQLSALHSKLTPTQYCDLMMEVGLGGDNSLDKIGVLSDGNPDKDKFISALVESTGYDEEFWKNANQLVMNVNGSIGEEPRRLFHTVDRLIDSSLIEKLKTEVPGTNEALKCVTEIVPSEENLLAFYLKSDWTTISIDVEFSSLDSGRVTARLNADAFTKNNQQYFGFVLMILKEFNKRLKLKNIDENIMSMNLDKEFIDRYVQSPYFQGILDECLMRSVLLLSSTKEDDITLSRSIPIFKSCECTRLKRETTAILNTKPEWVNVTINDEAWGILTTPCKIYEN